MDVRDKENQQCYKMQDAVCVGSASTGNMSVPVWQIRICSMTSGSEICRVLLIGRRQQMLGCIALTTLQGAAVGWLLFCSAVHLSNVVTLFCMPMQCCHSVLYA